MTDTIIRSEAVDPDDLSCSELRSYRDEPNIVARRYRTESGAWIEAVLVPSAGRAGIWSGGNVQWVDCSTEDDLLDVVERRAHIDEKW